MRSAAYKSGAHGPRLPLGDGASASAEPVNLSSDWQAGRFKLNLANPKIMGIVNVTPDSFSDGAHHSLAHAACAQAERLLVEGADILDIGAESTRPGATPPGAAEEWRRLQPVLRHVLTLGCPVSVDTSEPDVMQASLALGADVINDVRALKSPGALAVLAQHAQAGICLMHMQGEPSGMQIDPRYEDVVAEVMGFLRDRLQCAVQAGIEAQRIVLDPGFGFGKTLEHNRALAQSLRSLLGLGRPLLVGWSRKDTLGRLTGRAVGERLVPSVAAALAALSQGASLLRVHDVAATADALKVWCALTPPRSEPAESA